MSNLDFLFLKVLCLIVTSFLISLVSYRKLIKFLKAKQIIDIPNHRSSHSTPTPRGGGIVIVALCSVAILILTLFEKGLFDLSFLAGFILLGIVGFLDDKLNLAAPLRFVAHFFAVWLVYHSVGGMNQVPILYSLGITLPTWTQAPLFFLWCLSVMNIFNFMDGINGYAGAQTLVLCVALGIFFPIEPVILFVSVLAGVTLGFLRFNWTPSKIFMGDVGSIPLGYLAAVVPLYLPQVHKESNFSILLMFLWFFVADGTWVIIRRILKRERFWTAHRTHAYQRLNILGWSHEKVVFTLICLQVVIIAISYFNIFAALGAGILCLLTILRFLTIRECQYPG